jgi:hypothetical protein
MSSEESHTRRESFEKFESVDESLLNSLKSSLNLIILVLEALMIFDCRMMLIGVWSVSQTDQPSKL